MNNYLNYSVEPNGKFTRFIGRPIEIEKIEVEKEIMVSEIARVEDHFEVEYPVRREFLKNNDIEKINYRKEGFNNVYTPFESDRVDYSTFISTPHKLFSYVKTNIQVENTKGYDFTIRTCGALVVWVNGEKQLTFSPYTRNHYTETDFVLNLKEGSNEVVIYFEDLAERDVSYYFELINRNDTSLKGFIKVAFDLDKYLEVEKLLYSSYLEKDLFTEGDVNVNFSSSHCKENHQLTVRVNPRLSLIDDGTQDGNITDFEVEDIKRVIEKDTQVISLGTVEEIPTAGFTRLELSIPIDDTFSLTRTLTCSIYDEEKFSGIITGNTLKERKEEALKYYASLDLEDINVALVNVASNNAKDKDIYTEYISAFRLIEEKGDCADFILAPLLAVYKEYKDNFPESFHKKMLSLSTDFRYWIDEPGNDVMWYFSENHALLFHVSQYLAGYIYPEDNFKVSGRKGREQYLMGKKRLEDWFEKFFQVGFSEWNSTTYFPIDFIGFFSLYIAAPDETIKDLAKQALDYTFNLIAINYHGGTMASTYGRVYEHNLKAMKLGEISSIIEIAWKKGFFNNSLRAGALFSLTDYEPPSSLEKFINLDDEEVIGAEYLQGDNKALTYLYKRREYSIASVINYKSYQRGHQQHTVNVSLDDCTMLWINNPGEAEFSGGNRPSFWAGNDVMPQSYQYENLVFLHYDLQETDYKYTHLYLPYWSLDEIVEKDNWLFIRKKESYLAVFFENKFKRTFESATHGREVRSDGESQYIILKASSKTESGNFDQFIEETQASLVSVSNHKLEYVDKKLGKFVLDDILYINNKAVEYNYNYNIKIN